MSITDELLANSEAYSENFDKGDLPMPPGKKVAVVACMDARLNPYGLLGLAEGDAHVIRNAGGVITDDEIRSLAISQRLLGTEEIILIHHTDCGMLTFTDDEFKKGIQDELGIKPEWAAEAFSSDLDEDVRQSVARIKANPFIPKKDSVRGFVYEVETGKLREVSKLARMTDDEGAPISYKLLERGTPIVSSDGVELGTAERAIENAKEHIFDGIVMRAGERLVWVDAPEVARIYERRVVLGIDAEAAAGLGDYEPGAPEFRANVKAGRVGRFFGGGWRRS